MRRARLLALAAFALSVPAVRPADAQPAPTGTMRIDNVTREIEWCEEAGEFLRYRVQGIVYQVPRKGVEVTGLVCSKADAPVKGVVDPTDSAAVDHYMRHIHLTIGQVWPPPLPVEWKQGSLAIVRFDIGRNGQLVGEPVVTVSSGEPPFDRAVRNAVRQAQLFDPLPAGLAVQSASSPISMR
jgi:TonB family protein